VMLVIILSDPGCTVVRAGHFDCVQHYTHAWR